MMPRVKICGLARGEDALLAARLGADFLGLVLTESPRRVRPAEARDWVGEVRRLHPGVPWVGVFLRPRPRDLAEAVEILGLDLVQIHGHEAERSISYPVPWILALPADRLPRAEGARGAGTLVAPGDRFEPWGVLVDAPAPSGGGGTGRSFDWGLLEGWPRPERLFLAGGLGPDNVGRAIRAVRPYAVDASSCLESEPGRKDPERLALFFREVRAFQDECDEAAP